MIGVSAPAPDHELLREFFELFKVPWEFARAGRSYPVALVVGGTDACAVDANIVLQFGPAGDNRRAGRDAMWHGMSLPLYTDCSAWTAGDFPLVDRNSQESLGCKHAEYGRTTIRLGYDLCAEVRHLLTAGQPAKHAGSPTLDLHIGIVRDLIVTHGVPLAEIRPAPSGHPFMVCLTHDVDHPRIALHRFDATAAGFLYRAIVGSFLSACRRRIPCSTVGRNWRAVLKLPLVHLRLARDFWLEFAQRFLAIEAGLGSTFFFLPRKGHPGLAPAGTAPAARASGYEPADVAAAIEELRAGGCEIGLHGIDAWHDRDAATQEQARVAPFTSPSDHGIRMHWLYFAEQSPRELDAAGFSYDSTFGYNETVGFRAGTTQAFQPPGTKRLLELPLHAMDTALFYPDYLGLTADEAMERCQAIVAIHAEHGGAFTINWHDRSVAPERCWDTFYIALLAKLRAAGAWFPTAARAVAWFRKRRAATIQLAPSGDGNWRVIATATPDDLPPLCVRLHNLVVRGRATTATIDLPLTDALDLACTAPSAS